MLLNGNSTYAIPVGMRLETKAANQPAQGIAAGKPTLGWSDWEQPPVQTVQRSYPQVDDFCYMLRAITIFMISFDPPKIRLMRLSRYMRAMG